MVPAAFVVVGALPLSPNGKVDRAALAQRDLPWARRAGLRDRSFRPPATAAEVAVAAVWSDTLGNEHIGLDDSFFDLGGHSLLAIRMLSDLQDALPVEIPLRGLFESPTLEGFARRVEEQLDDAELTAMAALLREMEGLSEAEAAAPANHVEDFRRCSP
jgi:acyl carrier protein